MPLRCGFRMKLRLQPWSSKYTNTATDQKIGYRKPFTPELEARLLTTGELWAVQLCQAKPRTDSQVPSETNSGPA